MIDKPFISVIVPIYNAEKYIKECLLSLFNNTIAFKCEFILVNDCTPDSSMVIVNEVIKNYSQLSENIKIINLSKNKGSAAARQVALDIATGKYIICVDSDDWVDTNHLENLYIEAEKEKADIVCCNLIKEFKNKSQRVECFLPKDSFLCVSMLLKGEIPGWLPIKLVSRDFLKRNNIFFVSGINLWEDLIFSLKMFFYSSKNAYINTFSYHYRYNQVSYVNSINEKRISDLMGVVQEIETFLKENKKYNLFENSFSILKVRVKISVLSSCSLTEQFKYKHIYSEIDSLLMKVENINLVKKFAVFLLVKNNVLLGNLFLIIIKSARKIRYN